MKNLILITPRQCKAARDLLGWSQIDLKEKSGISANTIAHFEKDKRNLTIQTMEKIVNTFIANGITFENTAKKITVSLEIENL